MDCSIAYSALPAVCALGAVVGGSVVWWKARHRVLRSMGTALIVAGLLAGMPSKAEAMFPYPVTCDERRAAGWPCWQLLLTGCWCESDPACDNNCPI